MKVLIIGGAGLSGSHLAEKLLKLNYEVRVLDNLSSDSLQITDRLEKFYNEAVADKI
jgi:nucleoside-diphosphate-sugar epimerase